MSLVVIPVNTDAGIVPNGTDLYPNNLTLNYVINNTNDEHIYSQPNTTISIFANETNSYFTTGECYYNVSKNAIDNTFPSILFYQRITIVSPSNIETEYIATNEEYNENTNFYEFYSTFDFSSQKINETGNYIISVKTTILNISLTSRIYYNNYTFHVNSTSYSPPDLSNPNLYGVEFIGTFGGLILGASLLITPIFCVYKIKVTGEKLKWSVYGFILMCILFLTMIAFFQLT
jgi:hypothetical protein